MAYAIKRIPRAAAKPLTGGVRLEAARVCSRAVGAGCTVPTPPIGAERLSCMVCILILSLYVITCLRMEWAARSHPLALWALLPDGRHPVRDTADSRPVFIGVEIV